MAIEYKAQDAVDLDALTSLEDDNLIIIHNGIKLTKMTISTFKNLILASTEAEISGKQGDLTEMTDDEVTSMITSLFS